MDFIEKGIFFYMCLSVLVAMMYFIYLMFLSGNTAENKTTKEISENEGQSDQSRNQRRN